MGEPVEVLGKLRLHSCGHVLGGIATAIDQLLNKLITVLAAGLTRLDHLLDQLFGPVLRHLRELDPGVEHPLQWVCCHKCSIPLVTTR